MNNLNYNFSPLSSKNIYAVEVTPTSLEIKGPQTISLNINNNHQYQLDVNKEIQSVLIDALFGYNKEVDSLEINHQNISRKDFYQSPFLWLRPKEKQLEGLIQTNNVTHPLRPAPYLGSHYRRYIHAINKTLVFRTISLDDLDIFHEWHNQYRVSFFWELNKTKEELHQYIEEGLNKKHQIPMIVELDGEPVGYYEFYWVKEDRLGPYYDARPYDRGFHFLIGNKKYLGKANTDAIVHSALHFLYLDEARTEYVMAEPRHDNNKVLKYADEKIGWQALKVFDFPHKRAVLLQNSRDIFFQGVKL